MESHDSPENLIGYLLGALDDGEMAEVECRLRCDPELRVRLQEVAECMRPLRAGCDEPEPPMHLAERTSDFVRKAAAPLRLEVSGTSANAWSLSDLVMTVGIFAAFGLLMFPAISSSRERAHLELCKNNLRVLGQALIRYSEDQDGYFPRIPAHGNLAVAGVYAVSLRDKGLVMTDDPFVCPSSPWAAARGRFRVPSIAEVNAASGSILQKLHETFGGSYGYTLGYRNQANQLLAVRNQGRDSYPVMADAPVSVAGGRRLVSGNHPASLTNVLYEQGNARTVRIEQLQGSDDIFWNDENRVAAGLHFNDAVIGSSSSMP